MLSWQCHSEGPLAPLVGRDIELRHLLEAVYTLIETETPQLITIVGDPGIGKTRLLKELCQRLTQIPEALDIWLGRASQQTEKLPYALIRALFAAAFGMHESDSASLARARFEQGIHAVLGDASIEKMHLIGYLIGLDYTHSIHLQPILDDPQQIHDQALQYATQFFAARARQRPVILVLEDLHWADNGSLAFFTHLVQAATQSRILIIGTARPWFIEYNPDWDEGIGQYQRIELQPFGKKESYHLVTNLLCPTAQISSDIRHFITRRAEGNPFYIEELIKMLLADGTLVPGPTHWQVDRRLLRQRRVPSSLWDVLLARLQTLTTEEYMVISSAAVVGQVFWDQAVSQMLIESQPAVDAHNHLPVVLEALQRKGLIVKRQTSVFDEVQEYTFKHALLHEVTYANVSPDLCQRYHALVATWLSECATIASAGVIGEHYERAQMPLQAIEWYQRAGQQARDTYALDAALGFYRNALMLLPEDEICLPQRIALNEHIANIAYHAGYDTVAIAAFTTMQTAANETADVSAQARAWLGLARVQCRQTNFVAALESANHAEMLARSTDTTCELIDILLHKGIIYHYRGDAEATLSMAEQSLVLSQAIDDQAKIARGLNIMAMGQLMRGQFAQAMCYFEQSLQIQRSRSDRKGVAALLNNIGVCHKRQGNYRTAIPFLEESLALMRELGQQWEEFTGYHNLAGARLWLSDYVGAEEDIHRALFLAETTKWSQTNLYTLLAETYLGQGRVSEALDMIQYALDLAKNCQIRDNLGRAWRVFGMVLGHMPDHVGAVACFTESARIFAEMDAPAERARTLREWARYEYAKGDRARGETLWAEARACFTQLEMEHELALMGAQQ